MGKRGRIGLCFALLVVSTALIAVASRYEASAAAANVSVGAPRSALDRIASQIARKPVTVRCGGKRQWNAVGDGILGYAIVGGDVSTLAPRVCARLSAMRRGVRSDDLLMSGAALVTVAHESEHLHGISNEALAECYGIQRAREVALALGIDSTYTGYALQAYWANYPERPPAYRSEGCHDGGPLDLHPATTRWP